MYWIGEQAWKILYRGPCMAATLLPPWSWPLFPLKSFPGLPVGSVCPLQNENGLALPKIKKYRPENFFT